MSSIDSDNGDDDKAQAAGEFYQAQALANAKRDAGNAIAIGECLFCEAPLDDGIRWCDAECRDNWERLNGR